MSFELVRGGPCPQCGAPIEFRFAQAAAQICAHCKFVVARSDQGFRVAGRAADLIAIRTPFSVGASGTLFGRAFRIGGRVQYDRVDAASAPWEEMFLEQAPHGAAPETWAWLAQAQGKWLLTHAVTVDFALPTYDAALPGAAIAIPGGETFRVVERGAKKTIAGEGELPFPIEPDKIERYADLSGPSGHFGTIDYGDGSSPPVLYLGREIDPREIAMQGGGPPIETPRAALSALVCPGCGGNLPLAMPDAAERIVCRYCGLKSDVREGALVALAKVPLPPVEPAFPLGSRGTLRGVEVTLTGFMVRKTEEDGETFRWREYLLYGGTAGFIWLVEDSGSWEHIVPVGAGDVLPQGDGALVFRGATYTLSQSVLAEVESVVGEFYWKVEAGERVTASEYKGPARQKLSIESSGNEVTHSHSTPLAFFELRNAFGRAIAASPTNAATTTSKWAGLFWLALFAVYLVVTAVGCSIGHDQVFDGDVSLDATPSDSSTATTTATTDTGTEVEGASFTPEFTIDSGGRNLRLDLSCPELEDSWVGSDVALVSLDDGTVWEDSVELSYYSGVDDGESWSEGSREKTLWYSRVPAGRYVIRLDHATDATKPAHTIHCKATSATPSPTYMLGSLGFLVVLWLFGHMRRGASS